MWCTGLRKQKNYFHVVKNSCAFLARYSKSNMLSLLNFNTKNMCCQSCTSPIKIYLVATRYQYKICNIFLHQHLVFGSHVHTHTKHKFTKEHAVANNSGNHCCQYLYFCTNKAISLVLVREFSFEWMLLDTHKHTLRNTHATHIPDTSLPQNTLSQIILVFALPKS
jgi:hypothetical protein